ncbi:MAG TPA: hypothetical protein PKM27_06400 [Saprospiraceae bacterium]|nr:hypothetical protein [Saprospiraceae bacterium]HNT19879.1 hypothetical protein [Saprospiraceae bacterium]
MDSTEFKPKSFWKRPEGVTGAIVLGGIVIGGGILLASALPLLVSLVQSTLGLVVTLLVLGAIIYMVLDPKMRNLVWYMYKSTMRWITGLFVKIDPIGILKNYVEDLKANLTKMNQQINRLRGQMHKLKELMLINQREIQSNLEIASKAKQSNQQNVVILKSRKAGRLRESNMKYEDLYKKMEIMYRVLTKMFENSQIMQEDIADQVEVKEQERKAIHASNSAMRSAMSIIKGDKDKRAMFDQALEAVADDVSQKVGEMERFMELSDNFMKSIDLQNGVFEEEGLKMLEKWESEGVSKLLGSEKASILSRANNEADVLDLEAPLTRPEKVGAHKNQYDTFFED